jgi:trk system potassium uptake protein
MTKAVLVVGGGRVGGALAQRLDEAGHRVIVLDPEAARVRDVAAMLPGVEVVAGDGADPGVLEGAGIRTVDAVAAVTGDDARNLVIAALARFEFAVPRTIARIVDPVHAWLFDEAMGVDVAVDQAEVLTRLIVEEMSVGDVVTLVKLHRGHLTLVEERVLAGSHADGRSVTELQLPSACSLVAVIRADEVLVARGSLRLRAGDDVLAIVHGEAVVDLARALAGEDGGGAGRAP